MLQSSLFSLQIINTKLNQPQKSVTIRIRVSSVIPPDNHTSLVVFWNNLNNGDPLCPRVEDQLYPQEGDQAVARVP